MEDIANISPSGYLAEGTDREAPMRSLFPTTLIHESTIPYLLGLSASYPLTVREIVFSRTVSS